MMERMMKTIREIAILMCAATKTMGLFSMAMATKLAGKKTIVV
jgi:hypothetical protein